MSDPVNPFTQQAPDTEAPAASATPGAEIPEASATPGADQQAYGQQQYGQQIGGLLADDRQFVAELRPCGMAASFGLVSHGVIPCSERQSGIYRRNVTVLRISCTYVQIFSRLFYPPERDGGIEHLRHFSVLSAEFTAVVRRRENAFFR